MSPTHYTRGMHRGKVVLLENGKPRAFVPYCPGEAAGNLGREDVDRFLALGVTDFFLSVGRDAQESELFTTAFWHHVDQLTEPPDEEPECFQTLPGRIRYILARAPEARFLLRFTAHAPKSWREAYPEERVLDETGARINETSLASLRYEADYGRFLRFMVGWVERQPWADRVIGYTTFHEYEGTTLNSISQRLYDYSEPMQRAFREFAPEWKGEIPRNRFAAQRLEGEGFHWPDPATTRHERAYFELVRSLFLRRCRRFAETVKASTGGRQVLVGMDALKQGLQGWFCGPFFEGRTPRAHSANPVPVSGNFGAAEILETVDFLCTPHDYAFRQMGGAPEPEGIVDSALLRGRLFLAEDDSRTDAVEERESFGYFRGEAEVEAGFWRNAGAALARGYTPYWMDVTSFPSPRGGFFRSPQTQEVLGRIAPVLRRSLEWEHAEVPGIAVVLDDRAALDEDFSADFQNLAVIQQRLTGLSQCGVPYRVYLWEDLPLLPEHRLVLFPNLFRMDEQRLRLLEETVCRDGRTILWGPGTGISDGERLGAHWASRVTGMPMTFLPESYARRVVLTAFDHPVTRRLEGSLSYGDSLAYGPLLLPEYHPEVSVQGTVLTTRGVHRPGLAIREMEREGHRWRSIFTAAVPLPAALLREMARGAGAHVYSESNDVILASRRILCIHATRGGTRTIRLPERTPVWDLMAGCLLAEETDRLELTFHPPQTRLFYLGRPDAAVR